MIGATSNLAKVLLNGSAFQAVLNAFASHYLK